VARKSASHGTLYANYSSRPPRPTYDREYGRQPLPILSQENASVQPPRPAFVGMHKTTTETGDIGLFSIKPAHTKFPAASSYPLRTRIHEGDLNALIDVPLAGVPLVRRPPADDRKHLPSYNIANPSGFSASKILPRCQGGHQRPSPKRRPEENMAYRTYSMTQPGHLSTTLSEHKSYASLRSQQDSLMQRPRSPFPYPTRLKRPGFRPSSPVLADGAVDYARRAEIERHPKASDGKFFVTGFAIV
jgi:hypothetical protein